MSRFHAGMTLAERQSLRHDIEQDLVAEARSKARFVHRSDACRTANQMADAGTWTPSQVQSAHDGCKAEAMGGGCLDECHDAALQQAPEPIGP